MANEWQVKTNGKTLGPFTDAQLMKLLESERVTAETPVRRGANSDWMTAKNAAWEITQRSHGLPVDSRVPTTALPSEKQTPVQPPLRPKGKTSSEVASPPKQICPFCAEIILAAAIKCRYCGEFLDGREPEPPATPERLRTWSPGTAAVLSLIPGLGQIYKGQIVVGLLLMPLAVVGYCMFFVPGAVVHIAAMMNAYSSPKAGEDPKTDRSQILVAFALFVLLVFLIGFAGWTMSAFQELRNAGRR